jgi:hypothetical protein
MTQAALNLKIRYFTFTCRSLIDFLFIYLQGLGELAFDVCRTEVLHALDQYLILRRTGWFKVHLDYL